MTPVYEKSLHRGKEEHKFCVGGEVGGREKRRRESSLLWKILFATRRKKKIPSNYTNNNQLSDNSPIYFNTVHIFNNIKLLIYYYLVCSNNNCKLWFTEMVTAVSRCSVPIKSSESSSQEKLNWYQAILLIQVKLRKKKNLK